MDRLLFSSDLHGGTASLLALLEKASTFQAQKILLAGDTCPTEGSTFSEILKTSTIPLLMVRGNCDTQYTFQSAGLNLPPVIRRISFAGRTIVLIHGDVYMPLTVLDLHEHDILISGHTHCPSLSVNAEGILKVNPGSPTYPRSRWGATYGFLDNERLEIRDFSTDSPLEGFRYYFKPRNT